MMRYLSICSGIEATTVAWRPIGWKAVGFAEIEPFPCAVLAHHYPEILNHGDFTKLIAEELPPVDLVAAGTPCQDFSVAGLRKGMDGERGSLTGKFAEFVGQLRPRWLVWENVPGILSIDAGRAFGAFIGTLAQFGYGFAYRVLDAQYFGIPQRRRRVFLVGHFGDWRAAAAVLFERHSLSGHPAPGRETGANVAGTIKASLGDRGWSNNAEAAAGGLMMATQAITCRLGAGGPDDNKAQGGFYVPSIAPAVSCKLSKGTSGPAGDEHHNLVAHTLRGEGFDASEDGTGRQNFVVTPLQEIGKRTGVSTNDPRAGIGIGKTGDPMFALQASAQHAVAFDCKAGGKTSFSVGDIPGSLRGEGYGGGHLAVAVGIRGRDGGATAEISGDIASALRSSQGGGDKQYCLQNVGVRRLTPRECERLQGFPDDYTLIPYRGKPAADGPRYKALGNSMAVPVMRWIGNRIEQVERRIVR